MTLSILPNNLSKYWKKAKAKINLKIVFNRILSPYVAFRMISDLGSKEAEEQEQDD